MVKGRWPLTERHILNINQKIWTGFSLLILMVLAGSGISYVKSQKADIETHRLTEINLAEQDAA